MPKATKFFLSFPRKKSIHSIAIRDVAMGEGEPPHPRRKTELVKLHLAEIRKKISEL